jgi:hypothetical protein
MQSAPTPPPPGEALPESVSIPAALGFAFRAERAWMNILVASLLTLVPIAGAIALEGWYSEISQRLVRGHPRPIPTFDFGDFMHYLVRGLQPFAVRYVIALPLGFIAAIGVMVGFFAGSASLRAGDPSTFFLYAGLGSLAYLLVSPPFVILACVAGTRAELLEDFAKAFRPRDVLAYAKSSWGVILVSHLALGVVTLLLSLVGLVACYVGVFVVAAVTQLASVHLRWQLYERYVHQGGTPIEPKAPVWVPSEQARAAAAWAAQPHYPST